MIITRLIGGLGNQMFQFAAGYSFAKRIQLEMSIDMSFLNKNIYETENFTPRKFELDSFQNLPKCKIIEENLVNYFEINESNVHSNFPLRKLFKQKFLLNDYFQGERYFSNINNEVNKLFEFNKLLLDENTRALEKEILLSQNSVAIHVRRGDYLKPKLNEFHGTCEIDYYKKAVELIIDKTISPKFYFFSDDVNWVKSELASYFINSTVVENSEKDNWVDMYLMSLCQHNVIANSSYSWWSAYLNRNEHKIIIAPNKWYSDVKMNKLTKHLIPENWISI